MKNNVIYLLVGLLFIVSSCRKDNNTVDEIDQMPEIEVYEESDLTGVIKDVSGNLLSNATVTIGDIEVISDENGVYFFDDVLISQSGSLVTVEKPGFLQICSHIDRIFYPMVIRLRNMSLLNFIASLIINGTTLIIIDFTRFL